MYSKVLNSSTDLPYGRGVVEDTGASPDYTQRTLVLSCVYQLQKFLGYFLYVQYSSREVGITILRDFPLLPAGKGNLSKRWKRNQGSEWVIIVPSPVSVSISLMRHEEAMLCYFIQ